MTFLPTLGYEYNEREVTDTFRGYNHNLVIGEGEFYCTKNLSSRCFPLLANRPRRGSVTRLAAPGGLLAKEKLAWIDGGTLYYDAQATPLQSMRPGKKQLVGMGAYLCIFPDKLYYNTADPSDFGSMEAEYRSTGAVEYALCQEDGTEYPAPTVSDAAPDEPESGALWLDTGVTPHTLRRWSGIYGEWTTVESVCTRLRFISEGELPGLFRQGDGVLISGAEPEEINGDKILCAVGGGEGERDWLVVIGLLEQALRQTEGSVHIERKVPDMDFVIECRNRLWGCRYGLSEGKMLNEIYCCALGDFKNWRQYQGLSTDSWTASVGSDGPWTGAISYLGYPTFFKENRIHRVAVSPIGAHQITETVCRGVQEGCANSLQVVNETLLYKSRADICAYQGGFPESISAALGDECYSEAAAGVAGERYYLSMRDAAGSWQLFVYDLRRGLWMREDALHATAFARLGDELYALTAEGELLALLGSAGDKESFVEWEAETGLLYYQMPDRKYVSRFNLRLSLEDGAELTVDIMYDSSGEWVRQGKIRMKGTRTVTLPVRPRRCDHLRLRLRGRGEMRLYSLARILTIGSDVG